ncbi:MAG TPA: PQQ-dependent sugar dehydrogenase, partial [Vicinamibacterales bacterium]
MRPIRTALAVIVGSILLAWLVLPLDAQRKVPANNGTPVAPSGLKVGLAPDKPVDYQTAEGQNIRVSVIARGLSSPWSLQFVGSDTMLVTERTGRLRVIRNGVLYPAPVAGSPDVRSAGLCGLFDVALHPQFAQNKYVYL